MKALIKRRLHKVGWYKLSELVVGGHCGLCGAWIEDGIFPCWWRVGICKNCIKESEEE